MPMYDITLPENKPHNAKPVLTDPNYKHSIVDSSEVPVQSILAYITGSNWTVDYYSQLLGESEETKAFDPAQLAPYQNYLKINRLIIKLQGSLSVDDESTTNGRTTMTGTAIITPLPNLIPNTGDVIVADIGGGRAGQFTVSTIRKFTHLKTTAYEIQIRLDRIMTSDLEQTLAKYVSKEVYYKRDYLLTGQDALLTTDQYNDSQNLTRILSDICNQYVGDFYSVECRTLLLPNQDVPTYDPFVTQAVLWLFDPSDCPDVVDINQYNCDDGLMTKQVDIYRVLIERKKSWLGRCFNQTKTVDVQMLNPSVYQNSVRYSGVNQIVSPISNRNNVDRITELTDYPESLNHVQYSDSENVSQIPVIKNTSYVLSDNFYQNSGTLTDFESALAQVLNGVIVDPQVIYPFCDKYSTWSDMQRFYLGPLLVLLIKVSLRGR